MGIIAWILLGLIAGLLAKWIYPGPNRGGLLATTALGIVGALVGGFLGRMMGWGTVAGLNFQSILLAVGGALLVICLSRRLKR